LQLDRVRKLELDEAAHEELFSLHIRTFMLVQPKKGNEIIDWTSREIFNFIRAICKPGPMARSFIADKEVKINKANIVENAPIFKGINGSVIGNEKDGFLVKTSNSFIKIVEWDYEGGIKIGDRFQL